MTQFTFSFHNALSLVLLPFQLALYILSFLSPRDLLRAAQTCRYWRILAEVSLSNLTVKRLGYTCACANGPATLKWLHWSSDFVNIFLAITPRTIFCGGRSAGRAASSTATSTTACVTSSGTTPTWSTRSARWVPQSYLFPFFAVPPYYCKPT